MATLKGLIQDGWDFIRTKSADAADNVHDFTRQQGVRGQATTTDIKPFNPIEGQRFAPPSGVTPDTAPGRGTGRVINAETVKLQPTGLRGAIGSAVRGGIAGQAAYAGVKSAFDAAKEGNTDFDYDVANKYQIPFVGDRVNHELSPIRAAMVGAGRRFINNASFGLVNIGPEAKAEQSAQQNVVGGIPVGTMPPAQSESDNLIDTTRGLRVTPEQLIAGSDVPVEGQGAFKRTTPGNEGPATKVGLRQGTVAPAAPIRRPQGLAEHMVNLTALGLNAKAAAAREHGAAVEASLGVKAAQAGMTAAKTRQDMEQNNRKQIESMASNYITSISKPRATSTLGMGGESDKDYTDRISREKADFMRRLDASAAYRKDGKKLDDFDHQDFEQATLLDKIRRRTEDARSDFTQKLRDLVGNKEFDSNNLYSYAPVDKDSTILPFQGGYVIKLANGNTLSARRAVGGEWNITGPNGVVDKDVADFIMSEVARRAKSK